MTDGGTTTTPAPGDTTPAAPAAPSGAAPSSSWSWRSPEGVALSVVLVAAGLLGLGLRLWLLGNAPLNADEATTGLIADQILHGHTWAFYWGQAYGGVEPYVVAAAFAVAGRSPFVLGATPALLALFGSVLVWRTGRRVVAAPAAAVAGVVSWVWAESSLWNSVREYGFHEVGMALSMVVLLQGVRIRQAPGGDGPGSGEGAGPGRLADWVVLGAAGGLGFWASPEIVYVALPVVVVLAVGQRARALRPAVVRWAAAAGAAVMGALPWLWTEIARGGSTLPPSPVSYGSRLATFGTHVLPMVLGLRIEGAGAWEGGRILGAAAYAAVLALLVLCAALLWVRRPDARVVVLVLACFPFLYAAFPTSWFWNDGRYALTLTPVVALVLAGGLWELLAPRAAAWAACALLLVAAWSTCVAFDAGYGAIRSPDRLVHGSANPNPAVTALADDLAARGVRRAYAGYWVANDLTFLSGGRVTARAVGTARNPPPVATGGRPAAWVFVPDPAPADLVAQLGSVTDLEPAGVDAPVFTSWLDAHGIPYRTEEVGGFIVVMPSRQVPPAEVTGATG